MENPSEGKAKCAQSDGSYPDDHRGCPLRTEAKEAFLILFRRAGTTHHGYCEEQIEYMTDPGQGWANMTHEMDQ